jgi:mannose-6-phosphate isomerase-like protein (cupin superfamily)
MSEKIPSRQVALIKKAETEATYQLLQQIGIFGGENSDKVPLTISLKGTTWAVNLRKIKAYDIDKVKGEQLIQTPNYRLVTDAQIAYWNSLGLIVRTNTVVNTNYTVLDTDRNIECDGTFTVTLPLLADITHYEDIYIINNGTGNITIDTTGGELLYDTTSFVLYPGESLCIQKGDTKYLAK